MAINQSPMSRSISLPTQNVSTGSGLTQLSNASSAVSQLLTERINDVAISQATTQGANDVLNDQQPDNLALPFTKATKAYNNAVTDTENQRMKLSAENLINESLINNKNPATFTRDTPAKFKAELDGIKSGILQHARPESRAALTQSLDEMTAHASINMLQHSIEFDNKQTNDNMQHDISGLLEARRNAAVSGDMARIAGLDSAIDKTLSDYSTMNAVIARNAPYLRRDIEASKAVDNVLHGYSTALVDGTKTQYLSNLAENKENLPFNVWQDAVKGVVALDQEHSRLKNDINAEQSAQVDLGIQNNTIQNPTDILNYPDLTTAQKLTKMRQLEIAQAKRMKEGSTIITAQQNILSGRPEFNSGKTRDKMFESQIQALEQRTGQPATLVDMSRSVLGQNQYPASGLPDTPMGVNVPAFDAVMQGKLTGGDITATAQAAMVYNNMVNVQDKPNSINLTGDALAVATLFNTLNQGGTTPEQAAALAINTVLNASEPDIRERSERFHKTLEHVNPYNGYSELQGKFKEIFGSRPEIFKSDQAYGVFKDTYRANYIASNSEQAAQKAATYAMRDWGKSKYFDDGMVGNPVPEKELPITNIGYAFPNQIVSNLQGLINRNNAVREAHPDLKIPVIEWADKNQTISGTESEQDRVFSKLTKGNKPRIKIDGHETDVVLMPSAESRLGNRISYLFGVYDQFNNLHPLHDATNQVDGVARFSPQELGLWAPGIAESKNDESLRKAAKQIIRYERTTGEQALSEIAGNINISHGNIRINSNINYNSTHKGVSKKGTDAEEAARLEEVVTALKDRRSSTDAQATDNKINDAENVGINASLIPPVK